jgi:hypothetical protein
MGVEENNDGAINPPKAQPEIPEQEPIEQVFSQVLKQQVRRQQAVRK